MQVGVGCGCPTTRPLMSRLENYHHTTSGWTFRPPEGQPQFTPYQVEQLQHCVNYWSAESYLAGMNRIAEIVTDGRLRVFPCSYVRFFEDHLVEPLASGHIGVETINEQNPPGAEAYGWRTPLPRTAFPTMLTDEADEIIELLVKWLKQRGDL